MGQKFIARERYAFSNGAIGWRPGGPFDCLGPFAQAFASSARGAIVKRYTIPAGTGVNVGVDFYRVPSDTELRATEERSGLVFGFIDPVPDSKLGFMRPSRAGKDGIYVHTQRRLLRESQS